MTHTHTHTDFQTSFSNLSFVMIFMIVFSIFLNVLNHAPQFDDDDVPEDVERHQGLLREIRRSLKGMSTSMMRSSGGGTGSLTSISSGRSMASNMSVQSDSGLRGQQQRQRGRKRPSAPAAAGRSSAFTSKLPNWPPARKRYAGLSHHHRNWESEPLLEEEPMQRPRSSRTAEVAASSTSSAGTTEKEKSKAMLSVESKLMKSIKEVNESDLSENSTPVNSPAPQLMAVPCTSVMMTPSPLATPNVTETPPPTTTRSRPMLVKQKQSFHFPDPVEADDGETVHPVSVADDSFPVSQEETQGGLEGSASAKPEADPGAPKDGGGGDGGGGDGGENDGFKKVEKEKVKSAPVSFDREDNDKWNVRGKMLKQSSLDVEFMADRERLQVC